MKILITGGAGFVGSAVIRHIIRNTTDSVINIDKLTYAGNLESLAEISDSDRYAFEHADICHRADLERIFREYHPDSIMHLAAESHVDRSINNPEPFIQTNIIGIYTLLEVARNYWNSLSSKRKKTFRFHHVSTDEVYGHLENMHERFTEQTPYAPRSPYSASKACSDHLVHSWYHTYGLPVLTTHCSNNYGPYHFPEKLIPLTILNALEGNILSVYGSGSQIRDWLYVEDHARALHMVLMKGKVGETYNIGGDSEKQNLEVVQTICALLEKYAPEKPDGIINYNDLIRFVKDRPGHDFRYAIDASKIQQDIGWSPQESFASGMKKTIMWYLNNLEWCRRVRNRICQ